MKDNEKLIEEIKKRLPEAQFDVLEFIFYYLIR